ncbi:MAG: cupin domain-containing protein [Phycisphaeraceae bacterium]|nr:cupin domain-containing protein [Phycisphaeraceae bacterium]
MEQTLKTLLRHEADAPSEQSTCGKRVRLISEGDDGVAAWAHAVEIDGGASDHFHKKTTEIYYVLAGEGTVRLDRAEHPVTAGSIVHIPPGVVHGASGTMHVLVVGIPSIDDADLYFP